MQRSVLTKTANKSVIISTEPPPLPEGGDFFNRIDDKKTGKDVFKYCVFDEYKYEAQFGGYVPKMSESAIEDVHSCYMEDITRMDGKMPTPPDHFKRAGIIAYWLRRHAPVFGFELCNGMPSQRQRRIQEELLIEYGHVYLAFVFGYKLCLFFVREDTRGKTMPELDQNYIESICYLMKYKSVSPHSLGFIYRSLFYGFGDSEKFVS